MTPAPRLFNSTASPDGAKRELQQILASRRAAESALAIAMVTSAIPGLQAYELEQEIIVLPPIA